MVLHEFLKLIHIQFAVLVGVSSLKNCVHLKKCRCKYALKCSLDVNALKTLCALICTLAVIALKTLCVPMRSLNVYALKSTCAFV